MLLSNARQLPCCQQCPQLFRAIKPARVAMHQKKLHHQPTLYAKQQQFRPLCSINAKSQVGAAAAAAVQPESQVAGMSAYLDSLRWSKDGLVPVIVQHVDTGELLMQAFADRAALSETLQTGLATFYSRSRAERWCKGETSGNFIQVIKVYHDCDRDSVIYLADPIGPTCHTGARTCWYQEVSLSTNSSEQQQQQQQQQVHQAGEHQHHAEHAPLTTLLALEQIIQQRRQDLEGNKEVKLSWTAKLLSNQELLCKKIREEAGELCQTLEQDEGQDRAANEMADLLYHSMVLLNVQGVPLEDVLRVLRKRFGTSGVVEKASRPPKAHE